MIVTAIKVHKYVVASMLMALGSAQGSGLINPY